MGYQAVILRLAVHSGLSILTYFISFAVRFSLGEISFFDEDFGTDKEFVEDNR